MVGPREATRTEACRLEHIVIRYVGRMSRLSRLGWLSLRRARWCRYCRLAILRRLVGGVRSRCEGRRGRECQGQSRRERHISRVHK